MINNDPYVAEQERLVKASKEPIKQGFKCEVCADRGVITFERDGTEVTALCKKCPARYNVLH